MNDRYLFRAKRIDNGEWVSGSYIYTFCEDKNGIVVGVKVEKHWIVEESGNMVLVDEDTICQCTGLKDKNGKLIWENDIVEAWSQGRCAIGKIKHRIDGTWIMYPAWQNGEMWYLLPNDDGITTVEVIGNIFDNKELLESEDKDENNY